MQEEFHIGKLIQQKAEEKGVRIAWMAKQLGCHRNNVYYIFQHSWINTDQLFKISKILGHNFFADIAKYYSETSKEENPNMHNNILQNA